MFTDVFRTLAKLDPHIRAETELSFEADELEAAYGSTAVQWVRDQIVRASRTNRTHLYRLHDELVRRRGYQPAMLVSPRAG